MTTMETKKIDNNMILNSFRDILNSLSDKEKNVIERRIWLNGEKETLQNIWNCKRES